MACPTVETVVVGDVPGVVVVANAQIEREPITDGHVVVDKDADILRDAAVLIRILHRAVQVAIVTIKVGALWTDAQVRHRRALGGPEAHLELVLRLQEALGVVGGLCLGLFTPGDVVPRVIDAA